MTAVLDVFLTVDVEPGLPVDLMEFTEPLLAEFHADDVLP